MGGLMDQNCGLCTQSIAGVGTPANLEWFGLITAGVLIEERSRIVYGKDCAKRHARNLGLVWIEISGKCSDLVGDTVSLMDCSVTEIIGPQQNLYLLCPSSLAVSSSLQPIAANWVVRQSVQDFLKHVGNGCLICSALGKIRNANILNAGMATVAVRSVPR